MIGSDIYIELKVHSVNLDLAIHKPFILLKDVTESRTLTIYISPEQAEDMSNYISGSSYNDGLVLPRPRTYDLIASIFDGHDIKIDRILISSLQSNTFFASIFTNHNGQIGEFDARPSDAIAIAIRTKTPIEATEELMQIASVANDLT
jgi:bifunctional DNase/RNase